MLSEALDSLMEGAIENLKHDGEVVPVIFVEADEQVVVVGLADFNEKQLMFEAVGRMFKDKDVTAIATINDAYANSDPTTEMPLKGKPGTTEVLIVTWLPRPPAKETTIIMQHYTRGADGIELGEQTKMTNENAQPHLMQYFWKGYNAD